MRGQWARDHYKSSFYVVNVSCATPDLHGIPRERSSAAGVERRGEVSIRHSRPVAPWLASQAGEVADLGL